MQPCGQRHKSASSRQGRRRSNTALRSQFLPLRGQGDGGGNQSGTGPEMLLACKRSASRQIERPATATCISVWARSTTVTSHPPATHESTHLGEEDERPTTQQRLARVLQRPVQVEHAVACACREAQLARALGPAVHGEGPCWGARFCRVAGASHVAFFESLWALGACSAGGRVSLLFSSSSRSLRSAPFTAHRRSTTAPSASVPLRPSSRVARASSRRGVSSSYALVK